jgi:hypothetical protein
MAAFFICEGRVLFSIEKFTQAADNHDRALQACGRINVA